jgi:hypothetical protein
MAVFQERTQAIHELIDIEVIRMGKASVKTKFAVEKALEWFRDDPSLSFSAVSEALGYESSNTVSHWYMRNTCGFKEKYDALLQAEFAALEGPAIKCMGDLIRDQHSFQAAKYVLDNRGYKAADKIEANLETNITVNIEGD